MIKFLLSVATLVIALNPAWAECEDALVRATYQYSNSSRDDWRLSTLVSNDEWNQITQKGAVSVPIYGIPSGASYEEYQARAQHELSIHNESRDINVATNIAWTGLDSSSSGDYVACLKNERYYADGLHLRFEGVTATNITLMVRWHLTGQPASVTWTVSSIDGYILPSHISDGETPISIPRPKEEISLAGSSNGHASETIVLEPLPSPPPSITVNTCHARYPASPQEVWANNGRGAANVGYYARCAGDDFSPPSTLHVSTADFGLSKWDTPSSVQFRSAHPNWPLFAASKARLNKDGTVDADFRSCGGGSTVSAWLDLTYSTEDRCK